MFAKPQPFTAKVQEKIALNDKYLQLKFELIEPFRMEFKAGQYVSIQVSDQGERRSYSIASSPAIDHGFELLVDVEPQGVGSKFLQQLAVGDEIKLIGPLGHFVFDFEADTQEIVMVATGSGVAPFRSMILELLQEKNETRKITLLWGMRYLEHLFWQDEFQELVDYFDGFSFHPVISKPGKEWPLCRGRVTDCLTVHDFPENASFYLCGNAPMITDTQQLLTESGVKPDNIYHEKFF